MADPLHGTQVLRYCFLDRKNKDLITHSFLFHETDQDIITGTNFFFLLCRLCYGIKVEYTHDYSRAV